MIVDGVLGLGLRALETKRVLIASFCCRSHRVNEIVRDIKVIKFAGYLQEAALVRATSLLLLLEKSVDLAHKSSRRALFFSLAEARAIVATNSLVTSYRLSLIVVIFFLLTVIELGLSALNFKLAGILDWHLFSQHFFLIGNEKGRAHF